ncbi:MAG: hypothetical protein IKD47_04795 [Clostridia bacterium]|nr:hypothetical protein [Clostridia bacterium]
MKVSFLNGRIVTDGYFYEDVPYDVSANNLSVCFDGKGGLSKYLSVRSGKNYSARSMLSLYKNGEQIGAYTAKQTKMAGRMQELCLSGDGYRVELQQFITKDDDAVFVEITFFAEKATKFTLLYGAGDSFEMPSFSCNAPYKRAEENLYFQLDVQVNGEMRIPFVFAYEGNQAYCDGLLSVFDKKAEAARQEIDDVVIPASAQTEEEKALYLSAMFCCLENYKQYGSWEGFVAGCHYLEPLRTYYRDSYWTVLSMYAYDISLVKRQIRTLTRGVAKDGSCPSAVKKDFSSFWGGHYDSPSFFVMMVYDYVNHSGDLAFLQEQINSKSILEWCLLVINKQMERADETGLLYKAGPYNKLDWTDEVNRNGYVTYDEALYYRALRCMEKLCVTCGKDGVLYQKAADKVQKAINTILWDEEKGYYINYVDGDFTEDNLSVDTVLVYLFGIADEERSNRMLDAMERLLETKNNTLQQAGDYGIMCVYPFYKRIGAAYFKSSQDYEYHNGGNWPYWSAMYAYAKHLAGRDYRYALKSWFSYNLERGIFTPVEYFSPCRKSGSTLQAWSGAAAFVYDRIGKQSFFAPNTLI